MADKEISELTAATTPLAGTELVHIDQGGNSRKVALTDVVAISTGAMLKATYDPNDDGVIAVAQGGTNAATASGARTNLGLGTMAVQGAGAVAITGGSVTGITDLTVADGGTGASDASGARTNLGLAIGTDVQAYSANLAGFAATTVANVQNRDNHTGTQLAATISDFSTAADLRVSNAIGDTVQAYSALLDSVSDLTLSAGSIIYATGEDAVTSLPIGISGQVLAVNADGEPAWDTSLVVGGLLAANNLSDLDDADTALDNLGFGAAGKAIAADATVADVRDYLDTAPYVATRTALKALDTTKDTSAILTESGRSGTFVFDSSDLSSEVTADTQEGIYIAPTSDATGASGAWVRQYDGPNNIMWFGAVVGSYAVDSGPAIQAAHDALPSGGGEIFVPFALNSSAPFNESNRWAYSTPLVFTKPVKIVGEGRYASVLYYNGAQSTVAITAGTYGVILESLTLRGHEDVDGTIYTLGTVGIKSEGVVETYNSTVGYFQYPLEYNGSFYHKFVNSWFQRCDTAFRNFNANNLSFWGCHFTRMKRAVLCNAGAGPVSFFGCAIESWTSVAVGTASGAIFPVVLHGCYIENYPATTVEKGTGTDGATYNSGIVVANGGAPVSLLGNMISTKGITQVVTHSGAATSHINSKGNYFILFNTAPNNTLTSVFVPGTDSTLHSDDAVTGTPPGAANWVSSAPDRGSGWNPFTSLPLVFSDEAWTAPTFQNSWANDTSIAGAATAAYSRIGQWVYLRGLITGASSTGTTAFTLPAGFRPGARVYFAAHAVATNEDETTFAINTDGTVVAITGTTGSKLSLDDIRFRTI